MTDTKPKGKVEVTVDYVPKPVEKGRPTRGGSVLPKVGGGVELESVVPARFGGHIAR